MRFFKCIECDKDGHVKCTKEADSYEIKIDAKVINDLNEFVIEKFREAEKESDSDQNLEGVEDVDAFDYVKTNKKKKKTGSKKKE